MSLKIGVIYNPPLANQCALDHFCPSRGMVIDATRLVCDVLHFNCIFSWYKGNDYGDAYENGSAYGLLGAIQSGEFDTSIPIFTPTYTRSRGVDFSDPYSINDIILLTRAPAFEQQKWTWSAVSVFQWPLWLVFFLAWFLVGLVAIRLFLTKSSPASNMNFEIFFGLLAVDLRTKFLRLNSIRPLFAMWALTAVVVTSAYTGVLFSKKIIQETELPFTNSETFVQCVESEKCRLISHTPSLGYLSLGPRIQETLKRNPILMSSLDNIPKAILEEKSKYLVNVGSKNARLSWIDGNRNCTFYTIDLGSNDLYTFPVAKNSKYLMKMLNKMASAFFELGLSQAINRKYVRQSVCNKKWILGRQSSEWSNNERMLSFVLTTGCFYVLGICAGLIAFVVEIKKC